MGRVAFSISGLHIYWYGVTMALAVLSGVALSIRREKTCGVPKDTTLDMALFAVPIALVCARIYYIIFSWGEFQGDIWQMINFRQGGLAVYGSVIGGVATGYVYAKIKKVSFARMADMAVPSVALGQAIGRWGNFFNQEAYGAVITSPGYQWFPLAVFIDADQAWHYATFFYESVWCLFICVILVVAYKRRWLRVPGDTLLWYLMLYGAERSVVEGMRTDSLFLGPVRVSQALSLGLVFAGVIVILWREYTRARHWAETAEIPEEEDDYYDEPMDVPTVRKKLIKAFRWHALSQLVVFLVALRIFFHHAISPSIPLGATALIQSAAMLGILWLTKFSYTELISSFSTPQESR